jgi:hypothetical protein
VIGTEAEFSKKRCTMALGVLIARAINYESYSAAVVSENIGVGLNCIGSKCAQWCWYDYATATGETHLSLHHNDFNKGRREYTPGVTGDAVPARGYCGLTGSRE